MTKTAESCLTRKDVVENVKQISISILHGENSKIPQEYQIFAIYLTKSNTK